MRASLAALLLVVAVACLLVLHHYRAPHALPDGEWNPPAAAAGPSLPEEDNEDYRWVDPAADAAHADNCGNCHARIVAEWQGSGHAHAARNRRLLNLYDGTDWHGRPGVGWNLLADNPDGAGVCTSCHAPSVPFSDPAYYDLRQLTGITARGVHCDYCHKVTDVAVDQFGLTHGRFGLKPARPAHGQRFFGPLTDATRDEDAYSPVYTDSRYCASCHEGTVFGVPVYTTYTEWLGSPAGKAGTQCQTCHMTPTGRMTNIAPGKGGIERDPATLGNHRFFAGSLEESLRHCLSLTTRLQRIGQNARLEIELQASDVGHRVPTGFPDHHLVLVVVAFDRAGKQLESMGDSPRLPALAGRKLAGQAGILFAKQLSDFDGHSPAPFWRAKPQFVDSRLTPLMASTSTYQFPSCAQFVQLRLLYRRFWPEVAEAKGWPDDSIVVIDRKVELR
jgi:hypothetical protein